MVENSPKDSVSKERARVRREQTRAVMPLIGPLLDSLDGLPNDVRGEIEELAPELLEALDGIQRAMEGKAYD